MIVGVAEITIYVPWVHSLKEKRRIIKSICAKIRNKFNVSIAEVDEQDVHQTIVLGMSFVCSTTVHCDSSIDNAIKFIESNTEGEVIRIIRGVN